MNDERERAEFDSWFVAEFGDSFVDLSPWAMGLKAWQARAQRATPTPAQELAAALGWPGGISEPLPEWTDLLKQVARMRIDAPAPAQAQPTGYTDFQQRRGVAFDIIDEALQAYGQFLLDDDFQWRPAMDAIFDKMRERAALYAAAPPQAAAQAPAAPEPIIAHIQWTPGSEPSPEVRAALQDMVTKAYAALAAPAQAAQPRPMRDVGHPYRCIAPLCEPLDCSDCGCAVPEDVYAVLTAAQKWRPIETADPHVRALLYAPPEQLYADPSGLEGEMRVARPQNWTWARYWMPLPAAPDHPATQTPRPNEPELGADGGAQESDNFDEVLGAYAGACARSDSAGMKEGYIKLRRMFAGKR